MDEKRFQSLMNQAEAMRRLPGDQYYHGYLRGLRHFHGEAFGADAENNLWVSLSADDDKSRMVGGRDTMTDSVAFGQIPIGGNIAFKTIMDVTRVPSSIQATIVPKILCRRCSWGG